jgi:hypothetical protein
LRKGRERLSHKIEYSTRAGLVKGLDILFFGATMGICGSTRTWSGRFFDVMFPIIIVPPMGKSVSS